MVHIYVEYELVDTNFQHYAISFIIPSNPNTVVDFVKSNLNTKLSNGFHRLEYNLITHYVNIYFEFNSVLSTQSTRVVSSPEKHIYIVSHDTQSNTFTYITKLNHSQYTQVFNNTIEILNTNIVSNTTDTGKQYHYLIGFTTPQSFETVLEYLYSSDLYSDAIVTRVSDLQTQNLLEYVIDTSANTTIQASKLNGAYIYSLLSDRSVESIKTYHDASKRITQSHYTFEVNSIDSIEPKVYLEGNVGQVQNMSVFSMTKSVSKYYTFVVKMNDYLINKYTLPSFISVIDSVYDLNNLENYNGVLQNNTLYFCNDMTTSLHSNVSCVIDNAYLNLNNPSDIEFIQPENSYSHVVFATDELNNTFDFYIDYTDTSDANVVYSVTQTNNDANVEFTPFVSNVDFYYIISFDVSESVVMSDTNVQNGTTSSSDEIDYKTILNNNDIVHSSYGDIHFVNKLFDGIINYSNLENSFLSNIADNGGTIIYEFASGQTRISSMRFVQPPLDYLTGNIEIYYYADSSYERVSNVSHPGFDPNTTVYSDDLVITFDSVTSSKFKIEIHSINDNNVVGLSSWNLIDEVSSLNENDISLSNIETFFTRNVLGNIDTSIVGTHNNNVYFNYNTGLSTAYINTAFNALQTNNTNVVRPNGKYSSYMIYRKSKTYFYQKIYKTPTPEDTFVWVESNETEIIKADSDGEFNKCILSRDGTYCVLSGISTPGRVFVYKRNADLTYSELQWDMAYDHHLLNFGYCASLSHNGEYMMVTGPAVNYGAFYVFKRTNDVFVKHYECFLFKPEKRRHLYGMYNCISADGAYMVITATDDFNGGTVYIYKNTHDVITEITSIKNENRLNATFGVKCVVSDYGEYIVVSGVNADNNGGIVLVYRNDGFDNYEVFADLSVSASDCKYGTDIAISSKGEIVVVSGNATTTNGKCYIYRLNQYTNTYDTLHVIEKTGPFGTSCEISTERNIVVSGQGTAFLFSSDDLFDTYTEVDLSGSDSNGVQYGTASSISRDGKHVALGGPSATGGLFVIKSV